MSVIGLKLPPIKKIFIVANHPGETPQEIAQHPPGLAVKTFWLTHINAT